MRKLHSYKFPIEIEYSRIPVKGKGEALENIVVRNKHLPQEGVCKGDISGMGDLFGFLFPLTSELSSYIAMGEYIREKATESTPLDVCYYRNFYRYCADLNTELVKIIDDIKLSILEGKSRTIVVADLVFEIDPDSEAVKTRYAITYRMSY